MKSSRNYRPASKVSLRRPDKPTIFSIIAGILIVLAAYGVADLITRIGDLP